MKAIFLITISFLFSGSDFPQEKISGGTVNLQLTTRIIRQQYCDSGYSDMAWLGMSLQLIYTNTGEQPVILYRGSNLAHYVLVSLNEQNAKNKQYESDIHVGWVTSGEPKLAEGSKPGNDFIVLNSGQSYQTEADVSIEVALEPNSQFLKSGKHVLQIVVETWPGYKRQFDRLRNKWKKTGLLWGPSIRSEPMPIDVETGPKIVSCK